MTGLLLVYNTIGNGGGDYKAALLSHSVTEMPQRRWVKLRGRQEAALMGC